MVTVNCDDVYTAASLLVASYATEVMLIDGLSTKVSGYISLAITILCNMHGHHAK